MAAETTTSTTTEMRAQAAGLHQQADALPVWESRQVRAQAAMLRADARELVARARWIESGQAARYGLGDNAMTREIGQEGTHR